jgi:hypothetical protein
VCRSVIDTGPDLIFVSGTGSAVCGSGSGHEKLSSDSGRPGSLVVALPPVLVENLALLSDAIEDPPVDVEAILSVLTDDLTAAVPDYLGLTITLQVEDGPVIITTLKPGVGTAISSSLQLRLRPVGGSADITSSVVFFSSSAGSFAALADDARWIFNLDGPPVLDAHLTSTAARADPTSISGLAEFSQINQALGVLIDQGLMPREARTELRRRAIRRGRTMPEIARTLLGALPGRGPRPAPVQDNVA